MAKNKIKIRIDSDGTVEGTKLVINGEDITGTKNVTSLSLWADGARTWSDGTKSQPSVSCGYSTAMKKDDGSTYSENFRFSPGSSSMEQGLVGKKQEEKTTKDFETFIGKSNPIIDKIVALRGKVKSYVPTDEELASRTQESLNYLLSDLESEVK